MANITVIGGGYVGLVVAVGFAHHGHSVVVGERDSIRVERFRAGDPVIHEPRLPELLAEAIGDGSISFTTDNRAAVDGADAVFLALPTPAMADGTVNVSAIYAVLSEIYDLLNAPAVVVTKSTVPVGENARIASFLAEHGSTAAVVSNPEFLQEGSAVDHFLAPDRIVVGSSHPAANEFIMSLYEEMPGERVTLADTTTPEIIKYASNAFLATKIAFINEIARLCDATGGDVLQVAAAMGMDDRIGGKFLNSGPGYGGSCLPKDTAALSRIGELTGVPQTVVTAVIASNLDQISYVTQYLEQQLGDLAGSTIAVLGVAFKAGTGDSRDSPAVPIIRTLMTKGATVHAYDPLAKLPSDLEDAQVDTWRDAAQSSDAVILITGWPEFGSIDFSELSTLMRGNLVYDTRNVLDGQRVENAGLRYLGMGRSAGA